MKTKNRKEMKTKLLSKNKKVLHLMILNQTNMNKKGINKLHQNKNKKWEVRLTFEKAEYLIIRRRSPFD